MASAPSQSSAAQGVGAQSPGWHGTPRPGDMMDIATPRDSDDEMAGPAPTAKRRKVSPEEYVDGDGSPPVAVPSDFSHKALRGRYKYVKKLGKGAYGAVAEVTNTIPIHGLPAGSKMALKRIKGVFNTEKDAIRILRELRILRALRSHSNIVSLLDVIPPSNMQSFSDLCVAFEHCDSDLAKIINSQQFFTELHIQYIMYQLLLGIQYMHSANIVHRDLKPANILINADVTIRLADFGLARCITRNEEVPQMSKTASGILDSPQFRRTMTNARPKLSRQMSTHVVTRWYRPPEVILLSQQRAHMFAIDMWSAGAVFGELLLMVKENCPDMSREPLFPGRKSFPLSGSPVGWEDKDRDQLSVIFDVIGSPSPKEVARTITNQKTRNYVTKKYLEKHPRPRISFQKKYPGTSPAGIDLMERMLTYDYTTRINITQAVNHPYFAKVRNPPDESTRAPAQFDFEDFKLDRETTRGLIVDEILHYYPKAGRRR